MRPRSLLTGGTNQIPGTFGVISSSIVTPIRFTADDCKPLYQSFSEIDSTQ